MGHSLSLNLNYLTKLFENKMEGSMRPRSPEEEEEEGPTVLYGNFVNLYHLIIFPYSLVNLISAMNSLAGCIMLSHKVTVIYMYKSCN